MSCSCCCCVIPGRELLEGIGKKERLVIEEEEGAGGEEEVNRRNMDISLLREQYRSTRERQRRHTQVLLFRKVSGELSQAVGIIPVPQGLTAPPPATAVDPDPASYDPWRIHLDLHRRSCPNVTIQLPVSSQETTNTSIAGSSRRSSTSSSEAIDSQQESRHRKLSVDLTSDSPCSSVSSTKEEDHLSVWGSTEDPFSSSKVDPVQRSIIGPLSASEQKSGAGTGEDPPENSRESSAPGSLTGSDDSATLVASITCSPSSSATDLHEDLKENRSQGVKTRNAVQQTSSTPARRDCRKFSAPAFRFTRQLSEGGSGSSSGVRLNQNYHPFPNRKTPRISEAAKRLGLYSSF